MKEINKLYGVLTDGIVSSNIRYTNCNRGNCTDKSKDVCSILIPLSLNSNERALLAELCIKCAKIEESFLSNLEEYDKYNSYLLVDYPLLVTPQSFDVETIIKEVKKLGVLAIDSKETLSKTLSIATNYILSNL